MDEEIATLALPTMVALAAEPLYQLCDTAILGRVGTDELAGASAAIRVLALGYALFVFLLFGTNAAVARRRGENDDRGGHQIGVTALWLGLLFGVVAALVIGLLHVPLLAMMGATGDVASSARTYLLVSLAGFPGFTITMAAIGYLRGVYNTRIPLVVSVIGVLLNLIVEIWLVFGLDLDVAGSAASTVLAKWFTAIVAAMVVIRAASAQQVSLLPDIEAGRSLLVVGRDLIMRTAALLSSITAATALATRAGPAAAAAHSIAFAVWQFGGYIADGLEAAAQTLVANALGKGDAAAARSYGKRILTWCLVVGGVVGGLVATFHGPLASTFTHDPAVIALSGSLVLWAGIVQPLNAVAFGLDGILVGAGDQRYLAYAMVASASAFALAAALLWPNVAGLDAVWISLTVLMVVRISSGLIRFSGSTWAQAH